MSFNIVHFTKEISVKNISISKIIFNFVDNFNTGKFNTYFLSNKVDNIFLNKKHFLHKRINYLNFIKFLFSKKKFIIHVHDIWSIFTIFLLILACFKNIFIIIHTHGMLIQSALQQKSFFSFNKKRFFLLIINNLLFNNIFFITSTKQEKKSIKIYLSNASVFIVNNFINKIFISKVKLKKQFIFLGRVHPIKNIANIIKAFNAANLKKWKLLIYGILDNKKYLDLIKKKIKKSKNIIIKKPIFDNKKNVLIASSWANIIFSESELYSLSLIESSLIKTPTILSKKIKLDKIKYPNILIAEHNFRSLKNVIIKISKISKNKRKLLAHKIYSEFIGQFNNNDTLNYYKHIYVAFFK